MSAIEVKNLKKYFGRTKAVDGISFDVERGEIFGFLGPNGAGKTTTIRCMMDFLRPTGGAINILGYNAKKNSVLLKNHIGCLSGTVRLYQNWTGQEHINFAKKLCGRKSVAPELIKRLDFNPKIKAKNLSSGNRQKLGIILAFMSKPEILILDEPTMSLDPIIQNVFYQILAEAVEEGATAFISSHNLSEVERICHRVGIIKQGKITDIESVKDLKAKKMLKVQILFNQEFDKNDFINEDIELSQEIPSGLLLNVKGDIDGLIRKLSNYKIKDLNITQASLEEIFLEFYEK